MIVVDTNLLAYLLLPTPHAPQADAVLLKDPDWIAPVLIHSEFRNVLLGAVRRKDIEADDAPVLLDRAVEVITVPEGGVDGKAVLAWRWTVGAAPTIANSCGLRVLCVCPWSQRTGRS